MKRWLKLSIFLLFLSIHLTECVTVVKGDSAFVPVFPAIPATFSGVANNKVLDRATGNFYVGMGTAPTTTAAFSLAAISRYSGNFTQPQFTGIANDSFISGQTVDFLALAADEGSKNAKLAVVVGVAGNFLSQPKASLSSPNGTIFTTTPNLKDASGATNANGLDTQGIAGLAANGSYIFAAVRPNNAGNNFGSNLNGGIALVSFDQSLTTTPLQLAAVTGDTGIKAKKVDNTIAQVKTAATVNAPTFVTPIAGNNNVTLTWDSKLQRLFIGTQLQTGAAATDGAKSVIVARVTDNENLEFSPIAPDIFTTNNIVGVTGVNLSLSAFKVGVMHTSTGASYLIVHGGNGTLATTANGLYALPLVDVGDPADTTQGTLANKNSFNTTTHRFESAATINAHLPVTTDSFARVGGSPLPGCLINDSIYDLVVVGDTVYATPQVVSAATSTPDFRAGIFYSQALFDDVGKIVNWTAWTKRALPFDAFPYLLNGNKGFVFLFDVDAVNGKVWAIDFDGKTVVTSSWDKGSFTPNLTTQNPVAINQTALMLKLNSLLSKGSFSALDLDQSTRGLGTSAPGRYALFGGLNKIVFAKTSTSLATVAPFDFSAGIPITQEVDFFDPTVQPAVNYYEDPARAAQLILETELPICCAKVLEYSRRVAGTADNYFFAGGDNGLYVFADSSGNGFNVGVTPPNNLNAPPFFGGNWHKIATIPGAIVDIKTSGLSLYVLTLETKKNEPITSKIYNIPFAPSISAMFDPTNIFTIAETENNQSGSDLSSVKIITSMQIIATGSTVAPTNKEQLVISTNTGVFKSNADQTSSLIGLPDAANQTAAAWTPVDIADTTMYSAISGIDTPIRRTTWPVSILDESGQKTFARGGIRQLNGVGNTAGTAAQIGTFVPRDFHSSDSTNTNFKTFDAITNFWSDGTRRFFTLFHQQDGSAVRRLLVSPYNILEWGLKDWCGNLIIDPNIALHSRFFWVKQIGATGILMTGTEDGIVALE